MLNNPYLYSSCSISEPVDLYKTNELGFRANFTIGEYQLLQRLEVDSDNFDSQYTLLIQQLPTVVFMDLIDLYEYIDVNKQCGLTATDIQQIVTLVCDYIGDESCSHEALWNIFDEQLHSTLDAMLGSADSPLIIGPVHDRAMEIVFSIAHIVFNYLVNIKVPIVNNGSAYTFGSMKNGIVALRLLSLDEIYELNH